MLLPNLFIVFTYLAVPHQCANILAIFPFPQYSHTMPFTPILKELAALGHNVTFITPFELVPNPPGVNQIKVNVTDRDVKELRKPKGVDEGKTQRRPPTWMFQLGGLWPFCRMLTPLLLERVIPLLPPRGSKYDLVITEPFFCTEPLLATSFLYDAPVIATLPMELYPSVALAVGNPLAFSYVPAAKLPFTAEMTFLERVWNTIVNVLEITVNYLYHLPRQDRFMRDMFGIPDIPYIASFFHNISLVLVETHFSLSYPRPYMKNVLEVGGISVQLAKPLSKELETYMTEAKDGVIYFSLGSHMEMSDADKSLQVMMQAFSKLKQKVLFKWHNSIPNVPNNVLVKSWFPQPSILAHNNTVLFISHCGLNSMYEAAYYGVPVLGTPIFADQPFNTRILERIGMAVGVHSDLIEDGISFPEALERILSDPSFREKAQKQSRMIRDRPMDVVKEAVYWIEYILRHGGSRLQPITKQMPLFSIALIDVSLFIVAVLATYVFLLYSAGRFCLSKCLRKTSQPVSQRKKVQ